MVPPTHEVTNQPPALVGYDAFSSDPALVDAVRRDAPPEAGVRLAGLGRLAGSAEAQAWGAAANAHPPVLRTHDRYGNRVDEVDFDPAWHRLLEVAVGSGLAGGPWRPSDPISHVERAAGFYVWSQVEAGHGCPVSMTYAAVPALRADPELAAAWLPGLTAPAYDPGLRPPAAKRGLLAGMAMTEKQGGSDVRANTTRARPAADGTWRLTGHKWFCSAPMCDVFLTLAQAPGGLTCFVVPRVLPDGSHNPFRLQRLKDKLGNRSNASAELEYDETVGYRLGEEGHGVRTIVEMVTLTRVDCVTGSAALQRQALTQAAHHTAYREAFGRRLAEAPLMRAVVADLAVEAEAAAVLALRLARALDAGEPALLRLAVPVAKYWVGRRTPYAVAEALECLGGNGYVEESGLPRLYREAPLNAIWEGSSNVQALDVLRTLTRVPEALPAYLDEVRLAGAPLHAPLREVEAALREPVGEAGARRLTERLALTLQGALLVRHAPPAVADAFLATRLGEAGGHTFGALPAAADTAALLARATPPGPG